MCIILQQNQGKIKCILEYVKNKSHSVTILTNGPIGMEWKEWQA